MLNSSIQMTSSKFIKMIYFSVWILMLNCIQILMCVDFNGCCNRVNDLTVNLCKMNVDTSRLLVKVQKLLVGNNLDNLKSVLQTGTQFKTKDYTTKKTCSYNLSYLDMLLLSPYTTGVASDAIDKLKDEQQFLRELLVEPMKITYNDDFSQAVIQRHSYEELFRISDTDSVIAEKILQLFAGGTDEEFKSFLLTKRQVICEKIRLKTKWSNEPERRIGTSISETNINLTYILAYKFDIFKEITKNKVKFLQGLFASDVTLIETNIADHRVVKNTESTVNDLINQNMRQIKHYNKDNDLINQFLTMVNQ